MADARIHQWQERHESQWCRWLSVKKGGGELLGGQRAGWAALLHDVCGTSWMESKRRQREGVTRLGSTEVLLNCVIIKSVISFKLLAPGRGWKGLVASTYMGSHWYLHLQQPRWLGANDQGSYIHISHP